MRFVHEKAAANFARWFAQSKAVDASGAPLVLYHSSTADFARFKRAPNDIGMHFGTAGQAEDRFLLKQHHDPYGIALGRIAACTLPVYVAIARPLRLRDLGTWGRDNVVANLPDEFTIAEKTRAQTCAQLRDLLKSHGYDGVVYNNEHEAAGAHAFRLATGQAFGLLLRRFPETKSGFSQAAKQSPEYAAYLSAIEAGRNYLRQVAEDSWIAFEPSQIKSAIGNCGAYNRRSAQITDSSQDEYLMPAPCA